MIKELQELRSLLAKVANEPMIDAHLALAEARRKVQGLITVARENEAAQDFLRKQYARSIY